MNKSCTVKDLKAMIDRGEEITVLDVRSPMEFKMGHVPGAINLPLGSAPANAPALDPASKVAIICHSGMRSSVACKSLAGTYPSALNVEGGTAAWQAAGYELEKTPTSSRSIDRQAHFIAGLMLIAALTLGTTVSKAWFYLAALPAFGLWLDAFTGFCPVTVLLRAMPFNR